MVKVGCCGFCVKKELYYKDFDTCEVQTTFYSFPKPPLLTKWRSSAPPDFQFTIKASQIITHPASSPTYKRLKNVPFSYDPNGFGFFRNSKEVKRAWDEVKKQAEILKAKIILFQTPPSFQEEKRNIKNLYSFFSKIEREGLILIWEPRGNWSDSILKKISQELKLVLAFDPTAKKPIRGSFQDPGCSFYFRLHGGKGYRHKFRYEELKEIALSLPKKNGFIMFNNLNMFTDGKMMKEILRETGR